MTGNKTGTIYRAIEPESVCVLPTKHGIMELIIKPFIPDMTWVAVNNVSVKKEGV